MRVLPVRAHVMWVHDVCERGVDGTAAAGCVGCVVGGEVWGMGGA